MNWYRTGARGLSPSKATLKKLQEFNCFAK
jgi:hypothetical protein